MKKIIIVLLLSIVNCQLSICQIGTWRNYLAYSDIQQIKAAGNDNLFVLASNDLYQYNKTDQSIYTYDKTFAELGLDIKNQISHRARATAKLAEFLRATP